MRASSLLGCPQQYLAGISGSPARVSILLKPLRRGQLDEINSGLFSRDMLKVLFVFVADKLYQLVIRVKL